jgi:hypothetical protein
MEGSRLKIARLAKDLVTLCVANVVELEDLFLCKESSLAK